MKSLIKNYPKVDGHRLHYALYPVFVDGKYYASEIVEGGYISPKENLTKIGFKTQEECKKSCDIHNGYHGWDSGKMEILMKWSMQF